MLDIGSGLKSNTNLLYVDLPGFGETSSAGIDYSMEDVAHGISNIIERLQLQDVYMLGYSMGGRVALSFAVTHSDQLSGLILESASPGINDAAAKEERIIVDFERAREIMTDFEKFVASWGSLSLFNTQQDLSDKAQRMQQEVRLRQNPLEVADSLKKYGTGMQPSYWPHLEDIHVPVLQITGAMDDKFIAINEDMNRHFPDAAMTVIDGAGHNIHLEEPSKFGTIITEFLLGG